jgi:hypothetical protein
MTNVHHTAPHVTARQERIRVISEGVVASYIHDISARDRHSRTRTRAVRSDPGARSGRSKLRRAALA